MFLLFTIVLVGFGIYHTIPPIIKVVKRERLVIHSYSRYGTLTRNTSRDRYRLSRHVEYDFTDWFPESLAALLFLLFHFFLAALSFVGAYYTYLGYLLENA